MELCKRDQIKYFRGSENDVLNRCRVWPKKYAADTIVRYTGDCPLVDPLIIDETSQLYQANNVDFAASTGPLEKSHFSDGSDVEAFSFSALEKVQQKCKDKHNRGHVTFYFWKYDNGFRTVQLENDQDYSAYRFTVDCPEDFDVMQFLIKELSPGKQSQIKGMNKKYHFGLGWEQ